MSPGDRFGRMTFVATADATFGKESPYAILVCDCGQHTVHRPAALESGSVTECRYCSHKKKLAREATRRSAMQSRRRYEHETNAIRLLTAARVRAGLIRHPGSCEICESTHRVMAHHESYFAPDDVVFLCQRCHHKRHHRLNQRGRDPSLAYANARDAGAAAPVLVKARA